MSDEAKSEAESFPGWRLVGALVFVLFFLGGGGLYVFPVFIESYQAEFGWSMTEITGSAAVFAIVMGFSGPLVGVLFGRIGARKTMLTAAIIMGVATLAFAKLNSLTMLYLLTVGTGLGVAGTTILPTQTLVTNWFDVYRGRALGLAMLGIGLGGFVLPQLNEWLIRTIGWRYTWGVAGLVTLCFVVPVIAIFVRTHPSDVGSVPDGIRKEDDSSGGSASSVEGLPFGKAVRTTTFVLLIGIYLTQLTGLSAINIHFVPFAIKQAGFSAQDAARYFGLAVGFSIFGRLAFGMLADRWSPKWLLAIAGVLLATGPAVLEILVVSMGLREAWLLIFFAIPFGIGIGGNAVVIPVLVGRCFGALEFSKIMGVIMSGFALGIIVGAPVSAYIYDTTGSYETVLILSVTAFLLSAVLAVTVDPDKHLSSFETAEGARPQG